MVLVSTLSIPRVSLELSSSGTELITEHYILADDSWKYDVIPEIYNGKNVADFIDPDIEAKLEALEREEEALAEQGFYASDDEEIVSSTLLVVGIKLTFRSIPRRKNSEMPLPRSTSVNLKSRRSPRKRTSYRTDLSFPERRSLSPYLVLPRVCVMPATTLPLSRNVPHDSWLKRRPNGKLPTNGTRLLTKLPRLQEIWMSTWTMEYPPPHRPELQRANEEVLSTVHPDPIDNLSVWLQGSRILLLSNFENSLSENQTGWQRLQSQIDMYPSRDRNGCWLERERVERRTEDSLVNGVLISSFWCILGSFTTCMACMYTLRCAQGLA